MKARRTEQGGVFDGLLLTTRESAGILDVSTQVVEHLVSAGYLTAVYRGQHWFVTLASVLAYRRRRGRSARSLQLAACSREAPRSS
ncbi:helix-turn-helix domain-containing protein [Streptomyces nigrescens]|uniref:helix-turn-helix domain-containing protein n=1 Tax=Streptomyces nigrescens TaxID=1920 RepID=UPI0036B89376